VQLDLDDAESSAHFGLRLVRRSVDRFGSYRHPDGGKVMWAVLGTPAPAASTTLAVPGVVDMPGLDRDLGEIGDGGATEGVRTESDAQQGTGEHPPGAAGGSPIHRSILVNGVRRSVHHRRGGWRLELLLGWEPDDPDVVDLRLRPTPLHPALPAGHWRVGLGELAAGLEAPSGSRAVHFYPDPAGLVLLVELSADPPQVVHAPLRQVRAFLDEISGSGHATPGDPRDGRPVTSES
jgi:hypothetical protein